MRIQEELKKIGYFWLPTNPDRKIPGTLIITEGGEIELEIFGLLDESIEAVNGNYDIERIIGEIEMHHPVTLENCIYKNRNVGLSKSFIDVNKALLGFAYGNQEIVLINTFQFSIEGIDEWVGLSGINVDEPSIEKQTPTITYIPPEKISLNLSNGMKLLIIFLSKISGFSSYTEAKILQKTYFKLISEQEYPLDDFISSAYKITNLLGFAIDKTVCIEQVSVTSKNICRHLSKDKTIPIDMSLYYSSLPYTKNIPKIDSHRMLFRFPQIREDAERIFNNWLNAYDFIDPALNLYFSTKTDAYKYLDGKFLALAQGLETYHRRTFNEKLMDDAIFKELIEELIKQCPEDKKDWLHGRLQHGNELNLGQRLKKITEPFKELIGSRNERKKLIRAITTTRNYFTHYNSSLELEHTTGKDLWLLCRKMEAIFQLHILQVLGFTDAEVRSVFDNSYTLQQKLKPEKDIHT